MKINNKVTTTEEGEVIIPYDELIPLLRKNGIEIPIDVELSISTVCEHCSSFTNDSLYIAWKITQVRD